MANGLKIRQMANNRENIPMNDKNKKHYFDKVPTDEFTKTFEALLEDEEQSVIVWRKGNEELIEEFLPSSYRSEEKALYVRKKGNFLDRIAGSDFVDHEVLVKFDVDRYKYFLTAKLFFSPSAKEFKLSVAGDFYKSQQRANYRLDSDKNNIIQIRMNNYLHNGLDISAGGSSIQISAKDKSLYPKGKLFNQCELIFNGKKYVLPAIKIMGVFDMKDENGNEGNIYKLGLAFINTSKGTEEALFKQINSQIRTLEVKKKFNLGS